MTDRNETAVIFKKKLISLWLMVVVADKPADTIWL
jgi:hypothetical protein